jgi:hypothetical protein
MVFFNRGGKDETPHIHGHGQSWLWAWDIKSQRKQFYFGSFGGFGFQEFQTKIHLSSASMQINARSVSPELRKASSIPVSSAFFEKE